MYYYSLQYYTLKSVDLTQKFAEVFRSVAYYYAPHRV